MERKKVGGQKLSKTIQLAASQVERKTLDHLCRFFGLKSRQKLLRTMLVIVVGDCTKLKPEPTWTPEQLRAHKYFCKCLKEIQKGLISGSAKEIIREEFEKQSQASLESMSKAELKTLAEVKGISHTGLRKSGLIERLMNNG